MNLWSSFHPSFPVASRGQWVIQKPQPSFPVAALVPGARSCACSLPPSLSFLKRRYWILEARIREYMQPALWAQNLWKVMRIPSKSVGLLTLCSGFSDFMVLVSCDEGGLGQSPRASYSNLTTVTWASYLIFLSFNFIGLIILASPGCENYILC